MHLCRQASEWGSIGSQFFHTSKPQCNKRGVVSKTAPSPPKHDRPWANRTHFRHVSYCWLIPVRFRSRISKDTPSNVAQSQHWGARRQTWFICRGRKQQQGQWKEGQRSPQECHWHVCYHISFTAMRGAVQACAFFWRRKGQFQLSAKQLCFDFDP